MTSTTTSDPPQPLVPVGPPRAAEPAFRRAQQRGTAIGELARTYNARTPIAVLVATAQGAAADLRTTLAGAVLVLVTYAVAAALNDRADVVSDRVNDRFERPLVSGAATERDVRTILAVGGLASVASLAALPQPTGLAIAAGAAFLAWASACEPLHLQRRGFVGLVALATGYFVLPIVLVAGLRLTVAVAPLALIGAGVLAHKDVRDEVGDRASGKRTLLVRVGYGRMACIAAISAAAGGAGLLLTLGTGWWLAPCGVTGAALVVLAVRGHDDRTLVGARLGAILTSVAVGWAAGAIVS